VEYLIDKVTRFEHYFPKSSTDYLKENHYRLYLIKNRIKYFVYRAYPPKHLIDYSKVATDSIPIMIINYNRCETLMQMVDWLRSLNDKVSIIIADNASSYPPLLEYYAQLDLPNVQVIRFEENHGLSKLIELSQTLKDFKYYVLTDPDLIPYKNTSPDILNRMMEMMDKYRDINHIGASLEINDIPDHYPLKEAVVKWEERFWKVSREPGVYEAFVDTTFGMYRSNSQVTRLYPALRLGNPYTLKHVDWYLDPVNISPETQFNMNKKSGLNSWMNRLEATVPEIGFRCKQCPDDEKDV